jgi:hypothetical protein
MRSPREDVLFDQRPQGHKAGSAARIFVPGRDLRPNGGKIGAVAIATAVANMRGMTNHIFG